MLSALIPAVRGYPAMHMATQPAHQRYVQPGPLVLRSEPRKYPTPTTDRDRTVSRRSEPSSRATLIGEQPNPWDLLQPQDVTSRHRGAKPPVDMSSWGRSACYPRSTFYPLSDGPSTQNHRITMSNFRSCSARLPLSQAPLCHCTQRTVAKRAEGTLESLRYAFGGDHPSQTTRQSVSAYALDDTHSKSGISTTAPYELAPTLLSLPPILHILCTSTGSSCSEGSRGLFVP